MSKEKKDYFAMPVTREGLESLRSFFVPHKRVQYTGELVDKLGVVYKPESRTKQSFVAECDINNILKQYKLSGMVTHISAKAAQGAYTDLPDPIEFQESLNIVAQAENAFATLPSKVRERFGNDPERFLMFTSDPANAKEMADLGLTNPPPKAAGPLEVIIKGGGAGGDTPPADASPKAGKPASGAT